MTGGEAIAIAVGAGMALTLPAILWLLAGAIDRRAEAARFRGERIRRWPR